MMTAVTARALRPSISGLYGFFLLGAALVDVGDSPRDSFTFQVGKLTIF
jgi:hypothetical protein